MLKLRKIAITGGLSCGKSTVGRIFRRLGAYVVSADDIVHQLLSPDTNLGRKIVELLGSDVVSDGQFDKAKIAAKVFQNPELLKSYEGLLHPAVRDEVEKQYQQVKKEQTSQLFIAEIPLLFETKGQSEFDAVIVVTADSEKCRERFKNEKGYGAEEYDKRMARQMKPNKKASAAQFVIENNGSLEQLEESVKKIYQQINPLP